MTNCGLGLAYGTELGDMCELSDLAYQPLVGTYMVERTWSNAAAAAGHDPCVPAIATPYVLAATQLRIMDLNGTRTHAISIPLGASETIDVVLRSDGVAPEWTVQAIDAASQLRHGNAELEFEFDKTTGHDGDTLSLKIARVRRAPDYPFYSEMGLLSMVDGKSVGTWFALVTE